MIGGQSAVRMNDRNSFPVGGLVELSRATYQSPPLAVVEFRPTVFSFIGAGGTVTAVGGSQECAVIDRGYGPRVPEIRSAFPCDAFAPTQGLQRNCRVADGSRRGGQPGTAGPSDDGLKFGQFASIVQTCGDLVACEIGKFRDNVFSGFASGQVPEHKSYRNTCSLEAWFATQNLWVACDVVFPANWHGLILTRSYSKGKAGKSDEKQ